MHVRFQLDGKIWEEYFGLSCSLWTVESPPTPSTLLPHHHQIPVSPVLHSKEVAHGHQLLNVTGLCFNLRRDIPLPDPRLTILKQSTEDTAALKSKLRFSMELLEATRNVQA